MSSLYSFLTVMPHSDEQLALLEAGEKKITFRYPHLTRLKKVPAGANELTGEYIVKFKLYLKAPSQEKADELLRLQEALYGSFDDDLFQQGVAYMHRKAAACITDPKVAASAARILEAWPKPVGSEPLLKTEHETFLTYKRYFNKSYGRLLAAISDQLRDGMTFQDAYDYALDLTDLRAKGWQTQAAVMRTNALVAKDRKTIIVPKRIINVESIRLRQLVLHEITHAMIAEQKGMKHLPDSLEEGFCLVIEQMVRDDFHFKRLSRYLAIGLGKGSDGTPRTFHEAYELLWPALQLRGRSSEHAAKLRAVTELRRAFRGGDPNRKGFVFIKDKIYLEQNLKCWQELSRNVLSYKEFMEVAGYEN